MIGRKIMLPRDPERITEEKGKHTLEELKARHSIQRDGHIEWCDQCGRQHDTRKGKGMATWRTECQPTESYSTASILGHEICMEEEQWKCHKCSLVGKCLFHAACGHIRKGTKRKIHVEGTLKQRGFKRIREQEIPEVPDIPKDDQESDFKPLKAEDYAYSRLHAARHCLWHDESIIGCIRCGRISRKTSHCPNDIWKQPCRLPVPCHRPRIRQGKWERMLCGKTATPGYCQSIFNTTCPHGEQEQEDAPQRAEQYPELSEIAKFHMKKHDIRESDTHYGCIRCGAIVNKKSAEPQWVWRKPCIDASKPDPPHRIKLCTGGWRCERCGLKGYKNFRTACKKQPRYRQRTKNPEKDGNEHINAQIRSRELAEAGNREQGKQHDGNGERSQSIKRSALCREAESKNEENADPPRIKRYRIYRNCPDKIRSEDKEYGKGVYDICMKDLKKHTGRPPGAAGSERASASGPAPDN